MAPGAALSLAVHAGLIAALTLGVGWRVQAPEVVSAELWSTLPQVAAPKAEAPPPPPAPAPAPAPPPPKPAPAPAPPQPTEAQIATERAEKLKREEKERAEAEALKKRQQREADDRKQREAEEKKQREEQVKAEKAEKARLEKLREDQMKRLLGTLQGSGNPQSTGSASQDAGPSKSYAGKLINALRDNLTYNGNPTENPAAVVRIRAAPGGTIIARQLVRKSGVPEYDEAALRAVDKLGRLPSDVDGRVPTDVEVTFRLRE
jgi:colicin import membrane protein